jgi:alpha-tubulin suppressor-like RCC1 family protein
MGKGDGVIEQAGASPGAGRPAKMHDEKGVAGLPKLSTTSLTMVSKLTNKMTVDEVGTVMKDRFSKLSLPSLKTDNGGLSDGFIESKKKQVASPLGAPALSPNDLKFIPSWKDGVVVPEEEGYDDGGAYESEGEDMCVMWATRTMQHESGTMLLPTDPTGVLFEDDGTPMSGELDTSLWKVNNSVLVGISRGVRKLSRLILVSPDCTSLSPMRKLYHLTFLKLIHAKKLENRALRRMVPRHRSRHFGHGMLTEIDVTGCGESVEDEGMALIAEHNNHNLQIITAPSTNVGDFAMGALGEFCQNLRKVNFSRTLVSSKGVCSMMMGCPKVTDIDVHGCDHMTGRGALVVLTPDDTQTFPNKLKRLNFANTQFRNGCCYWLGKGYPSLEYLNISGCLDTSDAGVIELTRGCKKINSLVLDGLTQLTTIGIRAVFQGLPRLKTLDVSGTRRLNDHPFKVSAGNDGKGTKIEILNMSNMPIVTEAGLNAMATVRTLREIKICFDEHDKMTSHVTDKMQRALSSCCKQLRSVEYVGALWLTEAGIMSLVKNCNGLETLYITMAGKAVKGPVGFSYRQRGPGDRVLSACLSHPNISKLKLENSGKMLLRDPPLLEGNAAECNDRLEEVSFAGCTNLSPDGFLKLFLGHLGNVNICNVSHCRLITHAHVTKIISARQYFGFSKHHDNGFARLHPKFSVQDDFVAKRNRRRIACITITRYYRGFKGRQDFIVARNSAVRIQCMLRQHWAREKRAELYEEWKQKRVAEFMRKMRGKGVRVCYRGMVTFVEMCRAERLAKAKEFFRKILLRAASKCYRHWQEYVALQYRIRRLARRVLNTKLSMYFDMFVDQVDISMDNRLFPFAQKIQLTFRIYRDKKLRRFKRSEKVKKRLLEKWYHRGDVLTTIQRWWRGTMTRVRFEIFLGYENALDFYHKEYTVTKQHLAYRKNYRAKHLKNLAAVNNKLQNANKEQENTIDKLNLYSKKIFKLQKKMEVLRQLMRASRSLLETPLLKRLGDRWEWVAKVAYMVGHGHIAFDNNLLGFSQANPEHWTVSMSHDHDTPESTFELIDTALETMGERRTKPHLLAMLYKTSFKKMMDESAALKEDKREQALRKNGLVNRIKDLNLWKTMLLDTDRRFRNNSSMFYSPHLVDKWRMYNESAVKQDLANVQAIKIQAMVRSKLARRKLERDQHAARQQECHDYMNFRYVIHTFVQDSMKTGLEKIFDAAKEKIEEEKRQLLNQEKALAKPLVRKMMKESIARAHVSLMDFYEREDARYRLSVMEGVAFRLQSSWRGRRERARIFEENRRSRGSSKAVDGGWEHSVVLKPDGTVYSCGIGDAKAIYWRPGEVTMSLTAIPKLCVMAFKVSMVAAGGSHTLFLLSNMTVLSVGSNSKGQLGLGGLEDPVPVGTSIKSPESVALPDNLLAASVYAGAAHSMILTTDGCAYTFGYNARGQLGVGKRLEDCNIPTKVLGVGPKNPSNSSRWLSALLIQAGRKPPKVRGENRAAFGALGDQHSAILTDDGKIYMWGSCERGRCGIGDVKKHGPIILKPRLVQGISHLSVVHLSLGRSHTVAVTDFHEVFSWGDGVMCPIGHPERKIEWVPREIMALIGADVVKVECGEKHSVALTKSGRVMTWGLGKYGRCGISEGHEKDVQKPRVVDSLLGKRVIQVSAGRDFNWAIDSENTYYSFGHGYYGALGSGFNSDRHIAVPSTIDPWGVTET